MATKRRQRRKPLSGSRRAIPSGPDNENERFAMIEHMAEELRHSQARLAKAIAVAKKLAAQLKNR